MSDNEPAGLGPFLKAEIAILTNGPEDDGLMIALRTGPDAPWFGMDPNAADILANKLMKKAQQVRELRLLRK